MREYVIKHCPTKLLILILAMGTLPLKAAGSTCPMGSSQIIQWIVVIALFLAIMELRVRRLRQRNRELKAQLNTQSTELEEARESLQGLNLTDPLTGLPNRRYLYATISDDVLRTLKAHRSLALGISTKASNFDLGFLKVHVNQFKAVNERHGYAAGDQLIIHYKDLLLSATRGSDGVLRWDDDHFILVARSANRSDLKTLADRVCQCISTHPFEIDGTQQITCSCAIGWAVFPMLPSEPGAHAWEQVLELADAGMEMAKSSGENIWIGVIPGEGVLASELGKEPSTAFEALVNQGKLSIQSNRQPE